MQSNGIFEPIVHLPAKTAPIFAYCSNYVLYLHILLLLRRFYDIFILSAQTYSIL